MEMDVFTELSRGYGRVLLHHLYSHLYPELLDEIEGITADWSADSSPDFTYSSDSAFLDPSSLAVIVRGLLSEKEGAVVSDVGSLNSVEIARRAKLPLKTAQRLSIDLDDYHSEKVRLLKSYADEEEETLVGRNAVWLETLNFARKVARCNAPVMLTGETGTGKERVAKYIHRHSLRRESGFVPINCGALPESLVASELLGYEGGAFTGAVRGGRKGRLEAASGGTVFLDDVDTLTLNAQTSLLRFIETGEIQKVGGTDIVKADVRIICSSNRDLPAMVMLGEFRIDLYYRLKIFNINLPPLRERKDDIPLFARHFLKSLKSEGIPLGILVISDKAVRKLREYDWPGNLRELMSVIWRAAMFCEDGCINCEEIIFGDDLKVVSKKEDGGLVLSEEHLSFIERICFTPGERAGIKRFLGDYAEIPFASGDWAERFSVSTSTARKRLKALVEAGILRQEGTKKGSKYYVNAGR